MFDVFGEMETAAEINDVARSLKEEGEKENLDKLCAENGIDADDTENIIESIEVIGLCTDICVISNAMLLKAFLPEVPVIVDAACCAGVTPESHIRALGAMQACQIEVTGL